MDAPLLCKPTNQIRFMSNHSAKMGQHLDRLDDQAHEQSRKEAQERRQKKKDRKLVKKGKKDDVIADHVKASSTALQKNDDDMDREDDDEETEEEADGSVLPDPAQTRKRMNDIVNQFVDSLRGIRGSEPSADLFDTVTVNAYGANVPLNSIAQVTISSPTLAYANCFDPSLAKNVATAIRNQMVNLNPSVDDDGRGQVKIPLPRVSLETRQATAQQLRKRTEQYRAKIRGVRRSTLNVVKKGLAGKLEHVSKDDAFRVQQEIESVTEDCIKKLNEAADKKENDVMTG
ncbi:hypothetical protein MPSEU_001032500 [Mayamaea pseudoterrestris]|nr:hypothetical protein MPSEU_001032500 [Mayamaea pseudoterrestris]